VPVRCRKEVQRAMSRSPVLSSRDMSGSPPSAGQRRAGESKIRENDDLWFETGRFTGASGALSDSTKSRLRDDQGDDESHETNDSKDRLSA
jgi:hypothetical protein